MFIQGEIGERVSLKFGEIDYVVGQLNSYAFPHEMKKMLLILLAMVQKPFRFGVFGRIEVGRESFKEVSFYLLN